METRTYLVSTPADRGLPQERYVVTVDEDDLKTTDRATKSSRQWRRAAMAKAHKAAREAGSLYLLDCKQNSRNPFSGLRATIHREPEPMEAAVLAGDVAQDPNRPLERHTAFKREDGSTVDSYELDLDEVDERLPEYDGPGCTWPIVIAGLICCLVAAWLIWSRS